MGDLILRSDAIEALRKQLIETSKAEERSGWQNVSATAPIMLLFTAVSLLPSIELKTLWIPMEKERPKKGSHVLYLYRADDAGGYVVESGWAFRALNEAAIAWMPFIPYDEQKL